MDAAAQTKAYREAQDATRKAEREARAAAAAAPKAPEAGVMAEATLEWLEEAERFAAIIG